LKEITFETMKNLSNLAYIDKLADVKTTAIGEGTKIWQFSVVLPNAEIGKNCNINCHTFIENNVTIGDNVTVKSGVYIWDETIIEDDVFLGPNVVFTNDLRPRSKSRIPFKAVRICKGASIGANSTILGGVTIGKYAMSGIASVITKDVPNHALVYGNPARIMGWVDESGKKLTKMSNSDSEWVNKERTAYYFMTEKGLEKR
jgi:UDP-2-acetamido-3-amino-2,3-dideoxy-glucuronate N-acetyltransferase